MRVEGRKKYESVGVGGNKVGSVFIEELLEWLRKSKHQKRMATAGGLGSQGYRDEMNGGTYAR